MLCSADCVLLQVSNNNKIICSCLVHFSFKFLVSYEKIISTSSNIISSYQHRFIRSILGLDSDVPPKQVLYDVCSQIFQFKLENEPPLQC